MSGNTINSNAAPTQTSGEVEAASNSSNCNNIEQNKRNSTGILGKIRKSFRSLTGFEGKDHRIAAKKMEAAQHAIKGNEIVGSNSLGLSYISQGDFGKGFPILMQEIEALTPERRIKFLEVLFKNPESSPLYIPKLEKGPKELLKNSIGEESCTELKALKFVLTSDFKIPKDVYSFSVGISEKWNSLKDDYYCESSDYNQLLQSEDYDQLLRKTKEFVQKCNAFRDAYNVYTDLDPVDDTKRGIIVQAFSRPKMLLESWENAKENVKKSAFGEIFDKIQDINENLKTLAYLDENVNPSNVEKINVMLKDLLGLDFEGVCRNNDPRQLKLVEYFIQNLNQNPSYEVTNSEKENILKKITGLEQINLEGLLKKFEYNVNSAYRDISALQGLGVRSEDDIGKIVDKFCDATSPSLVAAKRLIGLEEAINVKLDGVPIENYRGKKIELGLSGDPQAVLEDITQLKEEIKEKEQREITREDIDKYVKAFLQDNSARSLKDRYMYDSWKKSVEEFDAKLPQTFCANQSTPESAIRSGNKREAWLNIETAILKDRIENFKIAKNRFEKFTEAVRRNAIIQETYLKEIKGLCKKIEQGIKDGIIAAKDTYIQEALDLASKSIDLIPPPPLPPRNAPSLPKTDLHNGRLVQNKEEEMSEEVVAYKEELSTFNEEIKGLRETIEKVRQSLPPPLPPRNQPNPVSPKK